MSPGFAAIDNVGAAATALVVLLSLSFFFSGTETAMFSLQKIERARIAQDPTGEQVLRMLDRRVPLLSTILIGNETVNVSIVAVGAALVATAAPTMPWLNLVIVPPILILLAEITPKILAFRFNTTWARLVIWPLTVVYLALTPARAAVTLVVGTLARLFGVHGPRPVDGLAEAEILNILDQGAETGHVDERERDIVEAVFEFGELTVGRLMTPRPDVFSVPADTPWDELLRRCGDAGFSRVPVYHRRPDDIIGILLIKDLLRLRLDGDGRPMSLRSILIPPVFVPQSKPANAMLREFLAQNQHMAFVVDEHGTLVGLVTLDDLLTELVGEFLEAGDEEEASIHTHRPGHYTVKAWMDVDDFAEETGITLPSDGYNTVGGFVFHQLGRLPRKGDTIDWHGHQFVVAGMEGRRIAEVHVTRVAVASEAV